VKQGAVAETALVTLATPGLFNDGLCKNWPREFDLLIRKVSPTGLDGLPSGIKRSYEDVHGVRIKDAGLYVSVEEVAHFAALQGRRGYIDLIFAVWRVILFLRFGESSALWQCLTALESCQRSPLTDAIGARVVSFNEVVAVKNIPSNHLFFPCALARRRQ
jgi:hypothetical protein